MILSLEHPVIEAEVDEFDVVHFSNYLKWYSNALKEFLSRYSEPPGFFGEGVEVRVARVRASYSNSALRDDIVKVSVTKVENLDRTLRLSFRSEARGRILARAELNLVFVQKDPYKLLPVPESFAARLAAASASGETVAVSETSPADAVERAA
ncbi:acyl-CoA thioesterase [Streptomyces sp. BI20]|uniref:acyl-CoA thioesterase n=1 Tax=Streptomyces sp. BI20 TaxID=3403460 RepID=UPI003C738F66